MKAGIMSQEADLAQKSSFQRVMGLIVVIATP